MDTHRDGVRSGHKKTAPNHRCGLCSTPYGSRTRVLGLRILYPGPLDEGGVRVELLSVLVDSVNRSNGNGISNHSSN